MVQRFKNSGFVLLDSPEYEQINKVMEYTLYITD